MNPEGFTFKGVLYVGLMLTAEGRKVVEVQRASATRRRRPFCPLLGDLFAIMRAVREQRLAETEIRWRGSAAACIPCWPAAAIPKKRSGKAIYRSGGRGSGRRDGVPRGHESGRTRAM